MGGENLWANALREYWRDPRNVIGPPGALVRRIFKAAWLVLSVYVLIWIAGPSQVASWRLWMSDDNLATHIAWGFTLAGALCFAIVRYAAEGTEPIKVPVFLPTFDGWRGWRTARLHLPAITTLLGSALALALFMISLLGMWNYYLHEQQTAGGASVAALDGSTSSVAEAQAALASFEARTARADAAITQAISDTPPGSPTGRSRLVAQQTEASRNAGIERRQLTAALAAARAGTVSAHQEFSDPRPVDAQMAGVTGMARNVVASLLDLMRSAVVEALLVMGAGLGLVGATSKLGVPAEEQRETENVSRESTDDAGESEEIQVEVEPVAADPTPQPARFRFRLPNATDEDRAAALAIGPRIDVVAVEPEETADEPAPVEPAPEPAVAADDDNQAEAEIDPFLADELARGEREAA